MKKNRIILSLALMFTLGAQSILAESYYLESIWRTDAGSSTPGSGNFIGFEPVNDINKFNATPAIPAGGITSADDVTVSWFADIANANIDVNKFTYNSSGKWDNGFSFNSNVTLRAREIVFNAYWDNNNKNNYNPESTDLRSVSVLNAYASNVTLKGNMTNTTNATFNLGTTYTSGTQSVTFDAYDASTTTSYVLNTIKFNYNGNNLTGAITSTANVKENTIVTVNELNFANSSSKLPEGAANRTSTFNIDGGVFNTGRVSYSLNADNVRINHISGTLGSTKNITLTKGSFTGSFNYALGENSIFDTKGNTIKLASDIELLANGTTAGLTVQGGGTVVFSCNASAVNGAITVKESSILDLDSGWVQNANSINVASGSSVVTSGAITLSSASNITLGVNSASDYAWLTGLSLSSSDSSYGSLVFNLDAAIFEGQDSITFALSDFVNAGTVDWSKFDVSANYSHAISGDNITFSVPEPATYAALFGALALAFAVYRRRK